MKAYLRHMRTSTYCCFLPDLTRFTVSYCAGPRPCQTKLSRDKLCTYYIYFSAGCQLFYTITRTTALKPLTSEHCIYHTNRPHGPGAGLPRFFSGATVYHNSRDSYFVRILLFFCSGQKIIFMRSNKCLFTFH